MQGTITHTLTLTAATSVLTALAFAGSTVAVNASTSPSFVGSSSGHDLEGVTFERSADGRGTVAKDADGDVVMSLTDGSVTVVVEGPSRTFEETLLPDVTVTTSSWVRLLDKPWKAGSENTGWFKKWYAEAFEVEIDDVLSTGMQYIDGAPDHYDADGVRYRGDAGYGPCDGEGGREIGSDFNDYLELDWTYPDGTVRPADPEQAGDVDCSGFIRLLYGYRMGIELEWDEISKNALPRQAEDIGRHGPGTLLADTHEEAVAMIDELQAGDLVLFDTNDDGVWNHVGYYLGVDSAGDPRFYSSRSTANGPTMSDVGGRSTLTGTGAYAEGFSGVRRL